MSVLLIEGFDHYIASLMTTKGWSVNPTSMQAGRVDGQCARMGGTVTANKTIATSTDVTFGFAFRWNSAPASDRDAVILRAGTTSTCRVTFKTSTKQFYVMNSSGTVIASGTKVMNVSTWYYVEVRVVINGASGTVELHVNEEVDIASTVGNFGSSSITNVLFQGPGGLASATWDYDDFYVIDEGVFYGDCRVETVEPIGDGTYDEAFGGWSPDTGATNYERVDEMAGTFPDGDTSYISTSNVNDRATFDIYAVGPIGGLNMFNGSIKAIQFNYYARKTDAGTRSIASVISMDNVVFHVGSNRALAVSYAFISEIHPLDPDSNPWTISSVHGGEYGVELTA